jgi:hypothetical protein
MLDGIVVPLARRTPCQVPIGADGRPENAGQVAVHAPVVAERET